MTHTQKLLSQLDWYDPHRSPMAAAAPYVFSREEKTSSNNTQNPGLSPEPWHVLNMWASFFCPGFCRSISSLLAIFSTGRRVIFRRVWRASVDFCLCQPSNYCHAFGDEVDKGSLNSCFILLLQRYLFAC